MTDPTALARELHVLGPFTAAALHPAGESPAPPWEPLSALTRPQRLTHRVAAVQSALAGRSPTGVVSRRVAASTAHLGLVARLVAPVLAMRALGHVVDPTPRDVWWQDTASGPVPVSFPVPSPAACPDSTSAVPIVLETLTAAVATAFAVSPKVLWGNVGSGVNSAVVAITGARPEWGDAVTAAARPVLADPRIDGGHGRLGPDYRRRSCCLIYRVAGSRDAVCGDCVLAP